MKNVVETLASLSKETFLRHSFGEFEGYKTLNEISLEDLYQIWYLTSDLIKLKKIQHYE